MKKIFLFVVILGISFPGYGQSAKKYYQRGNSKAELQDYFGAIEDFSKAIKKNPKFSEAYYQRGKSWAEVENYWAAVIDYINAIKFNPDYAEAYVYRGISLIALQDLYSDRQNNRIIPETQNKPDNKNSYTASQRKALQMNAKDSALYLKMLKKPSSCPIIDTSKAAIKSYTKAIKTNPMDGKAYFKRGEIKMARKDYMGAIDDFTSAIEIDPQDTIAYFKRGFAKNAFGDRIGALNDYSQAIELDTLMAAAYFSRGGVKGQLKDTSAFSDFVKAVEINPLLKLSIAVIEPGTDLKMLKDYSGAIDDYNKAIKINPAYGEAYYRRGLAYVQLNNKDYGCPDLKKAEELGDNRASELLKKYCK
jgi:tetratricopeptide (TPR) repeat protein